MADIWSALGGIGQVAGGLLGHFGTSKTQRREWQRQDTAVQRLVADARAAGMSPLAALGSPAAGSNATPVGQTSAGSGIGAGLNQLARSLGGEQVRGAQLDNEFKQRQIDLMDLEIAQSRTKIANYQDAAVQGRRPLPGTRGNPIPFRIRIVDPVTGREGWRLNPDILFDVGEGGSGLVDKPYYTAGGEAPVLPIDPYAPSGPAYNEAYIPLNRRGRRTSPPLRIKM